MTPNHDLFRTLFELCQKKVKTFDFLPNAQEKYPFVYLGENNGIETPNNDLLGTIRQTVHIYGLRAQRTVLDDISAFLETEVKRIRKGHAFYLSYTSANKQTIADNTDNQPLLHIVLDFTFNYTKKEN